MKKDPACPARGKACRKCKMTGHYEKVCRTKNKDGSSKSEKSKKSKKQYVRNVETGNDSETDKDYVFSLQNRNATDILLEIGGVQTKAIIDSG
jgi:hypothetical protein